MPLVSVVVPTYNRLAQLKRTLAGLERQQFPREQFEVVVVSDGSTDGTDAYLRELRTPYELRFVAQPNTGPASARNTAIRNARGDYILFIDDDIVAAPHLIAEHMRLHHAEQNLVVLGPMLSPDDYRLSSWVAWEQAMLMKQYTAMQEGHWEPTARQFYTGNTSVARSHLIEAGGFDERFRRAEDVELAYRLRQRGVRFVFQPEAIVYHYADRSFRSWLEIPYAYGRNDVIFSRERETWILQTMQREFGERNALTRFIVHTCLDRGIASRAVQAALKQVANLSYQLGSETISRAALSAIFNLRYYQGVADELGGRNAFFGAMRPIISTS
ncbi:MAG: glycosyltransferase family 2 protein [Chloroflexi bacterium OHK40]